MRSVVVANHKECLSAGVLFTLNIHVPRIEKKFSDLEIVMHSFSDAVHVAWVNHCPPGLQGELKWKGEIELKKVKYSTVFSSASASSAQFSFKRTNVKRFATIFWPVSTYHALA